MPDQHHKAVDEDLEQQMLAAIDAEIAAERASRRRAPARLTGAVLLVGAVIAWIASLALMIDKMHLLANPGGSLGCDINPFISCGSVMMTWQASAFGIPNMVLGLAGYAVMGTAGALLLGSVRLPRWFLGAQLAGIAFGFAFVHFLMLSAVFAIRALCPWCMVVWVATAPMFFVSLAFAVEERMSGAAGGAVGSGGVSGLLRRWVLLTVCWYVLVALVILIAFWSQWMWMLGL